MEIADIMKLLHPLSVTHKLEIIFRLTKELKADLPAEKDHKSKLLEELYGAWSDMDDGLSEDILRSRTISDRDISLD